jgi:hypothetical protein
MLDLRAIFTEFAYGLIMQLPDWKARWEVGPPKSHATAS